MPPGAAAVLLNRSHPNTDLVMPIDNGEKTLFDAIDGRRSLAEMAGLARSPAAAAGFFERLFRYDQVVFDASAAVSINEPPTFPRRPGTLRFAGRKETES